MMPALSEADAIIVGAGAVGMAAALALRHHGWRVALLEQRPPELVSRSPERVIALSAGSCQLLDSLGVWADIAAQGVGHIRHIRVTDAGNQPTVSLHHYEIHSDALGHVAEMPHILAPMWQRLNDCCYCPARITDMSMDDHGVELRFQYEQQSHRLRARLLLAADGTHSQIRRMSGICTRGWPHNRFAIVASVRFSCPHQDTAWECFRRSGPLALLPMADGRLSLVWAVDAAEAATLLPMADDAFARALRVALAEIPACRALGEIKSVGRRGCFPLTLQVASELRRGRTLLIGNAAHSIHPVAGQGMNLGLRDVADFIELLKGEAAPDSSVCLDHYTQRRAADIALVTAFTEGLLAATAPETAPARLFRKLGMRALQPRTPLKSMLLEHAAGVR